MSNDEEELLTLPCGCQMSSVSKTLIFIPHDLQCDMYLYVLEEVERQNKTVSYLDLE